jgi:MerR family transcriptional regulator, thiopeptide resistance regulator
MDSISALGRRFGLSRSALLHYDRIGLLRPKARSPAGYRRYGEDDVRRLETICLYRAAGVPLATIASLLDARAGSAVHRVLAAHLRVLGERMEALRAQQQRVLQILGSPALPARRRFVSAAALTAMLRAAGLDEDGLRRLHVVFERTDPTAHAEFLQALGLPARDIARLRTRARNDRG